MTGFALERLSNLCEINIGRTPSRSVREYWGHGSPWLSIADMNQGRALSRTKEQITDAAVRDANMRLVPAGAVLLSFKLSIGKVGIATTPMYTNEAIAALPIVRPDRLCPEFLYWALQSMDLTAGQDRAAMGLTLNKAKLSELRVPVPPLPKQRRIAAILDQAAAIRAKRRDALAQLDSLTQSIFINTFGDPGNPKGWDLVSLPEATDFQEGPGIMAKDFRQEGVPLVRLAGLDGANVSLRGCNFVDPDMFARKWAHFALNEGDILILTSATFGNPAVVGKEAAGAIFYTGIIRFKPKHSGLDAVYLRHFLASTWFMRQATAFASGAVIKHFGPTHLKQMTIPVPPLPLQRQFAQRAAQVELLRGPFMKAAGESERLFASLQHRAFAGQLS